MELQRPLFGEVGVLALVPNQWCQQWQPRHHVLIRLAKLLPSSLVRRAGEYLSLATQLRLPRSTRQNPRALQLWRDTMGILNHDLRPSNDTQTADINISPEAFGLPTVVSIRQPDGAVPNHGESNYVKRDE